MSVLILAYRPTYHPYRGEINGHGVQAILLSICCGAAAMV